MPQQFGTHIAIGGALSAAETTEIDRARVSRNDDICFERGKAFLNDFAAERGDVVHRP